MITVGVRELKNNLSRFVASLRRFHWSPSLKSGGSLK
jgi:hypothetical protein